MLVFLGWGKASDILYTASEANSLIYVFYFTRVKPATVDWAEVYSTVESIKNGFYVFKI
jgi:hypothetical protein